MSTAVELMIEKGRDLIDMGNDIIDDAQELCEHPNTKYMLEGDTHWHYDLCLECGKRIEND